jgi:hypothetical protein
VLAGTLGLSTMTLGAIATSAMGLKLLTAS